MFFSYVQISNASREAASYGSVYPNDSATMTSRARQETNVQGQTGESTLAVAATCANPAGTTISCVDAAGGGGTGNTVTVNVTERFSFLTPLINSFFGGGLDIKSSSTAAVLGLAPNGGAAPPSGCAPPTSAAFTVTVATYDVALDASAAAPSTGACAISGYDWDMGDGLDPFPPIVGRTASYTYAGAQTYRITLTVSNPGGELSSTQFIAVGPRRDADTYANRDAYARADCDAGANPHWPRMHNASDIHVRVHWAGQWGKEARDDVLRRLQRPTGPGHLGPGSSGTGNQRNRPQNDSNAYGNSGTFTVTLTVTNGSCRSGSRGEPSGRLSVTRRRRRPGAR